jgi:hypothetical protein
MKKRVILLTACVAAMTVISTSCKKKSDDPAPAAGPTLYERVGGSVMITDTKGGAQIQKGRYTLRAVTDSSLYVIAGDPALAKYFPVLLGELHSNPAVTTGFTALSGNFTDFLCVNTGSKDYTYSGDNMVIAHNRATNNRIGSDGDVTSQKVNTADFNTFVGDIGTGLAKNGVTAQNNQALVNDLVALLNSLKPSIVQR